MSVTIRTAQPHDIEAIYAISCSVHLTPLYRYLIPDEHRERFLKKYTPSTVGLKGYREKMLRKMDDPAWYIWVAETDDAVAGFTLVNLTHERLLLKGLFVHESYQGQGIGKLLFLRSQEVVPARIPIELEVLSGNERAIGMYERSGFDVVGQGARPFYGGLMLLMRKH